MLRRLTIDEVMNIIEFEDRCGINTTLQDILCTHNKPELEYGKDYEVIGDVDELGRIGITQVVTLEE